MRASMRGAAAVVIFFCHSAQPHLDGRYTVAGEFLAVGEALDALQVGDEILSVSVE